MPALEYVYELLSTFSQSIEAKIDKAYNKAITTVTEVTLAQWLLKISNLLTKIPSLKAKERLKKTRLQKKLTNKFSFILKI